MSVASPGAKTQKLPSIPAAAGHAEAASRIALRPVLVDDDGRRKRVLVRTGYLAAAAAIAYLIVVGISLTAGPVGPLAGLTEPLASIAAPAVAPPPVQQPRRDADVVTPAPATSPMTRVRRTRTATPTVEPGEQPAPTASVPTPAEASTE